MIAGILNKNINKLHAMNSLDGLGWSLVGMYIPIYLKIIGHSWHEVFVYYIVQNTAILFSCFVVAYVGRKISLQKILIIRFPFLLAFLVLLYLLETKEISIYFLALLDGVQVGLYALSMHVIFSLFVNKKDVTDEVGRFFAIPQFVSMFGPLLGGLISIRLGFGFLFGLGLVIFVLAFVPILFAKIEIKEYDFGFKEGLRFYRKYPRLFYAEIFNNIAEEIEGVIWPIFVFINVLSIASVGIVGTLLAASSALFTLYVGKISKKHNRAGFIVLGSVAMIIIWILRYFLEGELIFYALTIISGFVYVFFSVPYYAYFYEIGKNEEPAVFFAFREIPVWIARIIVFFLAIIFVDKLQYLFLVAAFMYLYFLFFWRGVDKEKL